MRLLKPKTILVDSLRRIIRIFFLAIFVRRIILLTSVQKWMRFIGISPTRNILVAYYLDPFVSFLFVSSGLFKSCPCTRGHGSYHPGGSSQNSIELKYSNGKVKFTKWKSSSAAFR
jgi:hypothetical protein